MPKGVMWRHEDAFFGAMGGGGGGGAAITRPEEIAERCLVPRTRCVPACPFMHGTAHWMAFSTLFLGGTVIIPTDRTLVTRAPVGADRARAGELPRDRRRRVRPPDARRARPGQPAERGRPRPVVLPGHPLRRRDPLAVARSRRSSNGSRASCVVDGYGASETGGQGQSVTVAGGADRVGAALQRQRRDDRARRRPAPGCRRESSACSRAAATSPSATTRTPRRPRRPSRSSTACGGRFPEIHAVIEDDGTITLLGRGSVSINTGGEKVYPEEVESALKSLDGGLRRGRGRAFPTARFGERRDRRRAGAAGVRADARRDPGAPAGAPGGLQGAARCRAGRRDRALAVGEARLPLGARTTAIDGLPTRDAMNRLARGVEPVPPPARRQPGRLVSVGRRSDGDRPASATGRSSSRSGTARATGAT